MKTTISNQFSNKVKNSKEFCRLNKNFFGYLIWHKTKNFKSNYGRFDIGEDFFQS